MKNRYLAGLLAASLFIMALLTGCGGTTSSTKNTGGNAETTVTTEGGDTKTNSTQVNGKSNHEKLLDVLERVKKKTGPVGTSSGLGRFIGNFVVVYKQDIAHPDTGATKIYSIDKDEDVLTKQDATWQNVSGSLIAVTHKKLKDVDTKQVTYACNAENKGLVIALVFGDGWYVYDIDAQGKKVNETVYMFPDAN